MSRRRLRDVARTGRRRLRFAALDAVGRPERRSNLRKLGTEYGGWTVPLDLIKPGWLCYAVGVGEDTSFDEELVARGCVVHAFDPTPRAIAHVAEVEIRGQFHFHPIGIWDEKAVLRFYGPVNPEHVSHSVVNLQRTDNFFVAEVSPLPELMQELGHARVDLVKLDIEGAEYRVLANLRGEGVRPQVLCVEFDQPAMLLKMLRELLALRRYGYRLVVRDMWNFTFIRAD